MEAVQVSTRACDLKDVIYVFKSSTTKENDLGETDFIHEKIKQIHASVTPSSGSVQPIAGDMERANITHKVIVRSAALPDISTDMYFVCRGQKLLVQYWYPIYKRRGFMEIFCTLEVE